MEVPYRQLLSGSGKRGDTGWLPLHYGSDVGMMKGKPMLATAHLYNFSRQFIDEFLPTTVGAGSLFRIARIPVHPSWQKRHFRADNLWDGLGALTVIDPEIEYFFGKVTMYGTYNKDARNMILYFLNKHFPDKLKAGNPIDPWLPEPTLRRCNNCFTARASRMTTRY